MAGDQQNNKNNGKNSSAEAKGEGKTNPPTPPDSRTTRAGAPPSAALLSAAAILGGEEEINKLLAPHIEAVERMEGKLRAVEEAYKTALEQGIVNKENNPDFLDVVGKLRGEFVTQIVAMKKTQAFMQNKIEEQKVMIDEMDQDRRFPLLLLHNIPEKENEHPSELWGIVSKVLKEKLDLDVTDAELSDCHRVGKLQPDAKTKGGQPRYRPIQVRFTRYCTRRSVWMRKKWFKGTGFMMTESLTPHRLGLLRIARDRAGNRCAWSHNGVIYLRKNDGGEGKVRVSTIADIDAHFPPGPRN